MSSVTTEQTIELIEDFEDHLNKFYPSIFVGDTEVPYSMLLKSYNFIEYSRLFIKWVTEE